MIRGLREIEFKWYVIMVILIYVPFHLLEEALYNFPSWMYEKYKLPKMVSYPHWLVNNGIFLTFLIIGLTIYLRNKERRLPFGLGILFWAFINSSEHITFTLIDGKLSPGFFTALLFLIVVAMGLVRLKYDGRGNLKIVFQSVLISVVMYWIIPILIIVFIGAYLIKIFP